ncbi:MAG: hypothetical protein U0Q15_07320 [Kineosporiaceae bacterium]
MHGPRRRTRLPGELSPTEREHVPAVLNSPRYRNVSVMQVWA